MVITILAAAAMSGIPVDVGRFDQSQFPNATKVERRMPHAELTHRVDRILAAGQCELPGQSKMRYNINVPYAVLMQPSGEVTRVVVKEIGCAPIELLVGQVALELSRAGDFRTSHQQGERWYVSELHFARDVERIVGVDENPEKVVCRATEPALGSRIARKRVCRTVAEWKAHNMDVDRLRRTLQEGGAFSEDRAPCRAVSGC
jgi:hypothetical protein